MMYPVFGYGRLKAWVGATVPQIRWNDEDWLQNQATDT